MPGEAEAGNPPGSAPAAPAAGAPAVPAAAPIAPAAGAPAATAPQAGAPAAGAPAAPVVAPAAIVYDLKAPEGVKVAPEHLAAVKTFAEANKVPAAVAQAVLERDIALDVARDTAWRETVKGYEATLKADPEIGGAKFDETIATAKKALTHFGDAGLVKALHETGLGSEPGFVRMMAKVGALLREPGHVAAPPPAGKPKTPGLGGALYGDTYAEGART